MPHGKPTQTYFKLVEMPITSKRSKAYGYKIWEAEKRRNKTAKETDTLRKQLGRISIDNIRILTVGLELTCHRGSCWGISLKIFAFEKIPPH